MQQMHLTPGKKVINCSCVQTISPTRLKFKIVIKSRWLGKSGKIRFRKCYEICRLKILRADVERLFRASISVEVKKRAHKPPSCTCILPMTCSPLTAFHVTPHMLLQLIKHEWNADNTTRPVWAVYSIVKSSKNCNN